MIFTFLHRLRKYYKVENANLETIEHHHCRYKDPELHKAEILRLLNEENTADAITTTNCQNSYIDKK
jgi:hypothetical protein